MGRLSAFLLGLIGVVGGVVVMVIAFVLLDRFIPPKTGDMLSFALVIVAFVSAALAIVGAVTIVNTWNDIDSRAKSSIEKYKAAALKNIDEKQKALNEMADRHVVQGNELMAQVKKAYVQDRNVAIIIILATILASFIVSVVNLWIQTHLFEPKRRHHH